MHRDVVDVSWHELGVLTRKICPADGSEVIHSLRSQGKLLGQRAQSALEKQSTQSHRSFCFVIFLYFFFLSQ